jgi:hypothetical protein
MIGRGTLVDRVCVVSVCVKIRVRCPTCVRTHWASHAAFHLWIVITWLRCASDCLGCNWTFRRSVRLTSARNYVRCLHFQTNWSFFCLYILPAPRSEESLVRFWIGRFILIAVLYEVAMFGYSPREFNVTHRPHYFTESIFT